MDCMEQIANAVIAVRALGQCDECLHIHVNSIVGNPTLVWLIYT